MMCLPPGVVEETIDVLKGAYEALKSNPERLNREAGRFR